jgi:5-methylcytosine-specific restriction endonuclease McrA
MDYVYLSPRELNTVTRAIINDYKHGASKRKLIFTLTNEEFLVLISSNCYYCGIPPYQIRMVGNKKIVRIGIDRLENSEGYTIENCVPCCMACNYKKGRLPVHRFMTKL